MPLNQNKLGLGQTGTRNPEVIRRLRELAADEAVSLAMRERAVEAIGSLKLVEAVPDLIALLELKPRDQERLRGVSVVALGKIGDPQAIEPLLRHWDVGYSTVVVYWIQRALDEALSALTGQKNIFGKNAWKRR